MNILFMLYACVSQHRMGDICGACVCLCLGSHCAENSEKINGGERINVKRLFTFLFNVRAYEFIMFT